MKILIVAATPLEVAPLIKLLRGKKNINVLITGIGGVATCYNMLKTLQSGKYDLLIQAGIAGSFDKKIKPGSVVAVKNDYFGDLGVVENKQRKNLFDLALLNPNEKPFKNGWLQNPHKKLLTLSNLQFVNAVSVNEITTAKADIEYYRSIRSQVESMEGAAFQYTALLEKIPFIQIRGISNYVGERNKKKWEIYPAIENLNFVIFGFLNQLQKK